MSSIQQAIADDLRGCRGGKFNPVALNSKQEQTDGPLVDDYAVRMTQLREEARLRRRAEGGRGGGYNDRQSEADRRPVAEEDDDVDEFGRRKVKGKEKQAEVPLSKEEKRRLALERLKQKGNTASSSDANARSRSPRR
mmetsp:Transcript_8917/g.19976  ORF Transcript_8917/g.19976 Transcript_8917/m.19976 type:complete len:138 (-) Transcript_8917:140-553(-)